MCSPIYKGHNDLSSSFKINYSSIFNFNSANLIYKHFIYNFKL